MCEYACVYVCMLMRNSCLALIIVSYGIRTHFVCLCVCVCVYSLCVYIRTSVLRVYIHIYTHIAINMYTLCVDTIHRYDPDFIVDDCISVN